MTIDGVLIAATKFVSPQEIDVTIGRATELVGKRARVTEGGAEFGYFCIQPNDPVSFPGTLATVQPLFPLSASTGFIGTISDFGTVVEVQNPNAAPAPGIFTLDATGAGPGAVLNQDNSVNGIANPALRGSVISIYATGEGQTAPAGVTNSVTQSNTTSPLLPVTVKIGGIEATVQYTGSAPDQVAGLLQVNAVVPQGGRRGRQSRSP